MPKNGKSESLANSDIARQRLLGNPKALARIAKALPIEAMPFGRRRVIIKEQAAALLGVDSKAIDHCLAEHWSELARQGYEVLRGDRLRAFAKILERYESDIIDLGALARSPMIAVMDFTALLDLAMLVAGSEKAELIRIKILDPCSRGLPCSTVDLDQPLREKLKPKASDLQPMKISSGSLSEQVSGVSRAISIRQPYVEQILRGDKVEEYRSMATKIRERVYLYASLSSSEYEEESYLEMGEEPGSFPVGLILGTVEIVDCHWNAEMDCFACALANPKRLDAFLKPTNQPQPKFWIPQF